MKKKSRDRRKSLREYKKIINSSKSYPSIRAVDFLFHDLIVFGSSGFVANNKYDSMGYIPYIDLYETNSL